MSKNYVTLTYDVCGLCSPEKQGKFNPTYHFLSVVVIILTNYFCVDMIQACEGY